MSEMLANQYFISRKYNMAVKELEKALSANPQAKSVKKKLIICYIKTNMIENAFQIFSELIKEDIYFIINTDVVADYCPCPQLIYEYENKIDINNDFLQNLTLGILWLYCDLTRSIQYFKKIRSHSLRSTDVSLIITRLNNAQKELKLEKKNE